MQSNRPKLLLIQPSKYNPDGSVYRTRSRWLMEIDLPYVAALTPPEWEVTIAEDRLHPIAFDRRWDLVGLSCMTHYSNRAYDIARRFRERDVPVVMGGFHATCLPEECGEHVHSVVVGEAENVWPKVLEDFKAGRLQKFYRASSWAEMRNLPRPRYELLDIKRYRIPVLPVQTTRGCPMGCTFCEVTGFYGKQFRSRPVPEVINEIVEGKARIPGAFGPYFVDDNMPTNRQHTMELFEAMVPLKIDFSFLANMRICDDTEMLDLAVRAGCKHINIGMESVDQENLNGVHKGFNKVKKYEEQLAQLRARKLFFSVNLIYGLDNDDWQTFRATVEFLERSKVPLAFVCILAPRVGTQLREQMEQEGRILTNDWALYDSTRCVFRPKRLSPAELERAAWWTYRAIYSPRSILRRVRGNSNFLETLFSNLYFMYCVRRGIHPAQLY